MKRSYAFWGMLCIVAGLIFLVGDTLVPDVLRTKSALTTIGALGIVALGISLVVASRRVQTLTAIVAGACIAFAMSMSILSYGLCLCVDTVSIVPKLSVETIGSGQSDESGDNNSDREHTQGESVGTHAPDTTQLHHSSMDTTNVKPIY